MIKFLCNRIDGYGAIQEKIARMSMIHYATESMAYMVSGKIHRQIDFQKERWQDELKMARLIVRYNDTITQNYPFCRLKFVVETFKHSTKLTNQSNFTKVPKVIKPTNKKMFY